MSITYIDSSLTEQPKLPCMLTIRQASAATNLPPHYLRRLCKTVPGLAVNSGTKYYINKGHLSAYFNGSQ